MEKLSSDPFGKETQGINYDIHRPHYPPHFIERIKKSVNRKDNYIDIASGPGILFFPVFREFQGETIIQDRSVKQLDVAREKLKEMKGVSKVSIIQSDAYEIIEHLPTPDLKFDLISIAQAYHWFEPYDFLDYVTKKLLKPDGTLAVAGYVREGFDYNYFSEDENFTKCCQKHYEDYFSQIKPFYDIDRDRLVTCHSAVQFDKYFEVVERETYDVTKELSLSELQKYLHTSSAYGRYVEKLKDTSTFVDPVNKMTKSIEEELAEFSKRTKIQIKEKPIVMNLRFFLILCKNLKSIL